MWTPFETFFEDHDYVLWEDNVPLDAKYGRNILNPPARVSRKLDDTTFATFATEYNRTGDFGLAFFMVVCG